MEDILSHFLDTRVTEEVVKIGPNGKPIIGSNGEPLKEIAYGISIQIEIEGGICKRTTGPFMTKETYVLVRKYYKDLKNKGKKDYLPLQAHELNQVFPFVQKIDTAARRVMEIVHSLQREGKHVIEHLGKIIDQVTHFKRTTRQEFKVLLSEPNRYFDATAAVNNFFGTSGDIETVEAQTVEQPVTTQLVAVRKVPVAAPNVNSLVQAPRQVATTTQMLMDFANIQFDSLEEFAVDNPQALWSALMRANLLEHLQLDPVTGKFTLKVFKFDLNGNFLDWYLISLRQNKKNVSLKHTDQCLNVREVLMEFLASTWRLSIMNGLPFAAFKIFNKVCFEELDSWMLNKKGYTRATASLYMGIIRTIFHAAEEEGYITNKTNPFRGKNRFKIPVADEQDRSVDPDVMARFLELKPSTELLESGFSHEWAWDMFVMSTMFYGINYMDLWSLEKEQVKDDTFVFRRAKIEKRNGKPLKITVHIDPFMKIIMEKWRQPDNVNSKLYFPFFNLTAEDQVKLANVEADLAVGITKEMAYKQMYNHIIRLKCDALLSKMGGYLKTMMNKIAKESGVPLKKKVTPYSSRSTFANAAIDQGVPPLRIMQSMGIRGWKAFMHYTNARLSDKEAKRMVSVFEEKLKHMTVVEEIDDDNKFEEGLEKLAA
jgi:integrase